MTPRAKISRFSDNSYYIEITSEDESVMDIRVVNRGKLESESFLIGLVECVDRAYEIAGLQSKSSKLCQRDDEQRMTAVKDLVWITTEIDLPSLLMFAGEQFGRLGKPGASSVAYSMCAKAAEIFERWNKDNGTMLYQKEIK